MPSCTCKYYTNCYKLVGLIFQTTNHPIPHIGDVGWGIPHIDKTVLQTGHQIMVRIILQVLMLQRLQFTLKIIL